MEMPTSDREKLDILEASWYKTAQEFIKADDPISKEQAYNRSDILLDGWLEIANELGRTATAGAS